MCVCPSFVLSTSRHPAQPVSVPILQSYLVKDLQVMCLGGHKATPQHKSEAEMSTQRRAPAVDGVQGDRGGGSNNRRSGGKPDPGNAERGEDRRSRKETAVEESKKEMTDRVARHKTE